MSIRNAPIPPLLASRTEQNTHKPIHLLQVHTNKPEADQLTFSLSSSAPISSSPGFDRKNETRNSLARKGPSVIPTLRYIYSDSRIAIIHKTRIFIVRKVYLFIKTVNLLKTNIKTDRMKRRSLASRQILTYLYLLIQPTQQKCAL